MLPQEEGVVVCLDILRTATICAFIDNPHPQPSRREGGQSRNSCPCLVYLSLRRINFPIKKLQFQTIG